MQYVPRVPRPRCEAVWRRTGRDRPFTPAVELAPAVARIQVVAPLWREDRLVRVASPWN